MSFVFAELAFFELLLQEKKIIANIMFFYLLNTLHSGIRPENKKKIGWEIKNYFLLFGRKSCEAVHQSCIIISHVKRLCCRHGIKPHTTRDPIKYAIVEILSSPLTKFKLFEIQCLGIIVNTVISINYPLQGRKKNYFFFSYSCFLSF